MAFWIKNNKKVTSGVKTFNSTLSVLFILTCLFRIIVRLRDKPNNVESELQITLSWVSICIGIIYLIMNFTHWLNSKCFENKNKEA
jgi:uncharacterized membrane protein HdeD (DUF308 family)